MDNKNNNDWVKVQLDRDIIRIDSIRMLTYKAEEAGGKVLFVDPRNTSKMCSRCRHIKENLSLKDRIFKCDNCGLIIDRDINAAINIYTLGRREINACGDETNMIEKATVSLVKETGNLGINQMPVYR